MKSGQITIRTSWITLHHFTFQELIGVIISPPITPNKFWGFNKHNSQDNYITLSCPYQEILHNLLHQHILRESIGVVNFTSVTPENSWGINCVILAGPMVTQQDNNKIWILGSFVPSLDLCIWIGNSVFHLCLMHRHMGTLWLGDVKVKKRTRRRKTESRLIRPSLITQKHSKISVLGAFVLMTRELPNFDNCLNPRLSGRFLNLDGPIRANHFRVPELNPVFANRASGG